MLCELKNITKQYGEICPINELDFSIDSGDYISVSGESGAGKSTLLFLIGGMLTPTGGDIIFNGQAYSGMSDNEISSVRAGQIGYVSQNIQLMQALTIEENIAFARKVSVSTRATSADLEDTDYIIDYLGLNEKRDELPCHLSGGQKRRAMLAVTWARDPQLYLLDEPTNDLDNYWSERVMELFDKLNAEGKTILLVTHNEKYASRAKKRYELAKGKLIDKNSI
ncbi:MAG: ABC transporter ATP-binding protein [Oscillospiraceae bacterium]|nr:ABC transporter ATP-binding protein [Oscillospiraceae bacterium]